MARPEPWSWPLRLAAAFWIAVAWPAFGFAWLVGTLNLGEGEIDGWRVYFRCHLALHWTWAAACLFAPFAAYVLMRAGDRRTTRWVMAAPAVLFLLIVLGWWAPGAITTWQASP